MKLPAYSLHRLLCRMAAARHATSACLLAGLMLLSHSLPADTLEEQLLEHSPQIIQALQDKGYKSVGVLKFRVQKGDGPISDNVGSLNMTLANRLEVALVLANPFDVDKQIKVLKKASSVAAGIPGANHTSSEGRAKLFDAEYPVAWGDEQVRPDAFLTGVAQIAPDSKTMRVGILAFDRQGGKLEQLIPSFTAEVAPANIPEIGDSFVLRGAFDGGKTQVAKAEIIEQVQQVKAQQTSFPLNDPAAPVQLDILYDGQVVPIEVSGGQARVPEPHAGQTVAFRLRRGASQERLAVVLKVNGENSLYRERLPDFNCRKWILEPGNPPILVPGFQSDAETAERFVVLTREESSLSEVNYGDDVGTLTLTVFREQLTSDAPPLDLPSESAEDLAALTRGVMPEKSPKRLDALKAQLREPVALDRGIVVQGERTSNRTVRVSFTADATPIMSATIRYYHP